MPFVPGHEVIGTLIEDCEDLAAGSRVTIASVLACAARGEDPPCPNCAAGDTGRCDRVTVGDLKAGLQTGYCGPTRAGGREQLVAHRSQLHAVPDAMEDPTAVLDRAARVRDPRRAARRGRARRVGRRRGRRAPSGS